MPPAEVSRHRFDVHEYHRMGEVGLLTEGDRVELIEGEIVEKNPIGVAHMSVVNILTNLLVPYAATQGLMASVHNPVRLDEGNEPEPDLALIASGPRRELPSPADTSLIIEVSDTTLSYDRNVKLPLYARAGIWEVWVVDLQGEKIEVYSQPEGETYREKRTFGAGEEVASATLEGLTVSVDEALA